MRLAWRIKRFIVVTLAVMFCAVFAFTVRLVNLSRLSDIEGERTYFLDSSSSQALRKTELSLRDIGRVKGECVRVDFSKEEGGRYALNNDYDALAQGIAERYSAKILFTEEVCGVTSYYAYTPLWEDFITVGNKRVNLHIAVKKTGYAVGTPMIFDGY